jgi:hypothetical protein
MIRVSSGGYYNGPVAEWARRNIRGRVEVRPLLMAFLNALGGDTQAGRAITVWLLPLASLPPGADPCGESGKFYSRGLSGPRILQAYP